MSLGCPRWQLKQVEIVENRSALLQETKTPLVSEVIEKQGSYIAFGNYVLTKRNPPGLAGGSAYAGIALVY
jgi:hypothetical protein